MHKGRSFIHCQDNLIEIRFLEIFDFMKSFLKPSPNTYSSNLLNNHSILGASFFSLISFFLKFSSLKA